MKTTSGMIYKRSKDGHTIPRDQERTTKGRWYVEFWHKGKRFKKSMGKAVTTRENAEQEAQRYLGPYLLKDDHARLLSVAANIAGTKQAGDAAEEAARSKLAIADVWETAKVTYSSRGATRRPLKQRVIDMNEGYWNSFVRWLKAERSACDFLEDVTDADARNYVKHLLEANLHPRTVTYHRNALNAIWRNAGKPSPWAAIPRYTAPVESRRHLEDEELRTVCTKATGELRRLLAIGLYTGLRLGDAVALQWKDIRAGWLRRRTAKRGKDVAFPIHPELAGVLAEVPVNERAADICPELRALYTNDPPALCKRISKHFVDDCKIAGNAEHYDGSQDPEEEEDDVKKDAKAKGKGPKSRRIARVGFHSLRHSFATICAKEGIPQGSVAAWLGHTPAVDEIYQHFGNKDTVRIISALPSGMFNERPALPPASVEAEELRDRAAAVVKNATPELLQKIIALAENR